MRTWEAHLLDRLSSLDDAMSLANPNHDDRGRFATGDVAGATATIRHVFPNRHANLDVLTRTATADLQAAHAAYGTLAASHPDPNQRMSASATQAHIQAELDRRGPEPLHRVEAKSGHRGTWRHLVPTQFADVKDGLVRDALKAHTYVRVRDMHTRQITERYYKGQPMPLSDQGADVMSLSLFESGAADHHGLLVSLWLPALAANRLAAVLNDGASEDPDASDGDEPESAEDLHLTLCYCGDVGDLGDVPIAKALVALHAIAEQATPLTLSITGAGRFPATPQSDGKDVLIAEVEKSPALMAFRQKVADALTAAGCPPRANFAWTPHITLAYVAPLTLQCPSCNGLGWSAEEWAGKPEDDQQPCVTCQGTGQAGLPKVPPLSIPVRAVSISAGDLRTDLPLGGTSLDDEMDDILSLGGSGSGNFGHEGRPGEVGGSAPGGGMVVGRQSEAVRAAALAHEASGDKRARLAAARAARGASTIDKQRQAGVKAWAKRRENAAKRAEADSQGHPMTAKPAEPKAMARDMPFSRDLMAEAIKARGFDDSQEFLKSFAEGEVLSAKPLGLGGVQRGKQVLTIQTKNGPVEGVFKPSEEGWTGASNTKDNEVLAYEVDRALGVGLTPPTVVREYSGDEGSLQVRVSGGQLQDADGKTVRGIPIEDWVRMNVLDNVIGNPDRHGGNVMVTAEGHLVTIDHGYAFSEGASTRESKPREEPHFEMGDRVKAYLRSRLDSADMKKLAQTKGARVNMLRRLADVKANLERGEF